MKKDELLTKMSEKSGLTKKDIEKMFTALHEITVETLESDSKITIPNICTFEMVKREARNGRNPQTGESIVIPERKAVKVKLTSKMKEIGK